MPSNILTIMGLRVSLIGRVCGITLRKKIITLTSHIFCISTLTFEKLGMTIYMICSSLAIGPVPSLIQ